MPGVETVLVALVLLQVKHLVADFMLQTPKMIQEKGRYGRPGGLLHAAIHVIGSAAVVIWLAPGAGTIVLVLVAEFLVHYHIDWCKEMVNRQLDMSPTQARFWMAIGADQMLHQFTYIGMLAWIMAVLA